MRPPMRYDETPWNTFVHKFTFRTSNDVAAFSTKLCKLCWATWTEHIILLYVSMQKTPMTTKRNGLFTLWSMSTWIFLRKNECQESWLVFSSLIIEVRAPPHRCLEWLEDEASRFEQIFFLYFHKGDFKNAFNQNSLLQIFFKKLPNLKEMDFPMSITVQCKMIFSFFGHFCLAGEMTSDHTTFRPMVSDRLMLANQNQDLEELRQADDIGKVAHFPSSGVSDMAVSENSGTSKTPQNDHF